MNGSPNIWAVILAVLLPPIGVWMVEGIGVIFLVSLILTCLAYVPGMIFSLVAVLRPDLMNGIRNR
ncbi:YqaE/Pmp3 family membrane protein [Sphingomonas sp. CGMCC 1.13654]|uniref:YqaE/Pmp3 family membrane protein n=1 Tax=Sphingomonas chungangi TaxID=2683589 RepID=A0A838L2Q2_9SPHN|nr:YqaE/Pmp3 family membrane protein [Sphingomonas chungangi]MBA2932699.1 YqaE/Pmp3 family membrane protein [Sphingomonas chungangi]MVW56321.1 YqaE/Pmp3 family membrane protein [Sphingomonas chungangi]